MHVINSKNPDLGIGKVIENDGTYLKVYFAKNDENREYSAHTHFLTQVEEQSDGDISTTSPALSETSEGVGNTSSLIIRVQRDEKNARSAHKYAQHALRTFTTFSERPDITQGVSENYRNSKNDKIKEHESLQAILHQPFHAMAEVLTETQEKGGGVTLKKQLFYANEHTRTNLPLGQGDELVKVLAWTHPGIQLAMSHDLREKIDIHNRGLTLRSVTPLVRAKFSQVLPDISGLYEPGGSVRPNTELKPTTGLKAIKLQMTREQVEAFLNKMNGMMLVSGAPGSGKTTVAMQRIRFLYDQQELRDDYQGNIRYSPELTRIFLANSNLIEYSKSMLEEDLHIPSSVVALVDSFISQYIGELWLYKHNAKVRRKKLFIYEERGRQAFWGLCSSKDLKDCWLIFESQISDRFKEAEQAKWFDLATSQQSKKCAQKLVSSLLTASTQKTASAPLTSKFNMDAIYFGVRKEYEELRTLLKQDGLIEKFDQEFQQWLFWVYDPFDGLVTYFSDVLYQGTKRIINGIGHKIREDEVLDGIKDDWQHRTYGKEEEPWLAFLLRFSLPTEIDFKQRFREIPNPLAIAGTSEDKRWTHVMIDEAQDLCVAEAALLSSFVHPDGAFTVAADFHQVVSPVWGMENPEAFRIGSSLRDKGAFTSFPFAKNMRQSKQIGLFLRSFYENVFGEIAPFSENDVREGPTPVLFIGRSSSFAELIKRRLNVLKRNPDIKTIALIQVNEDEENLAQYRGQLETLGISLAPIWQAHTNSNELITTSVERIKGLEYDACFVIGMDDIGSSTLKHSKNRAYVALSRPALQLNILCEETPKSLQKIDRDLIKIVSI
ncbi:MAG: hypothetical protein KJ990_00245 [Proteobacteria bacterium]|nr:hypothetical protein [Pseudomonadota bacterium]MBU1648359.1 hypothetical protein [Pseudomonadota bacterium]